MSREPDEVELRAMAMAAERDAGLPVVLADEAAAIFRGQSDRAEIRARAERLVDEHRAAHDYQFGHAPGARNCPYPGREDAMAATVASLSAESRCTIPAGLDTREVQDMIRAGMPWVYIEDPSGDPATERAKLKLCQDLADLRAGRIARRVAADGVIYSGLPAQMGARQP